MAAAYYALGDIDKAIEYTKKAISIKPTDRAYSNLGTMLFSKKSYEEAVEAYKKAIQMRKMITYIGEIWEMLKKC